MVSHKIVRIGILVISLFPFQCIRDYSVAPIPAPVRELSPLEKKLVASGNGFGWKLFQSIVRHSPNENIFISPLSVSMALGMAYNGAAGETELAMKHTLDLGDLSSEQINRSFHSLLELLANLDSHVNFEIANSIWYRSGFAIKPRFIDLNQKYFQAQVRELDFNESSAVDIINSWVNDHTHGKIPKILDTIDPLTMLFLINAIYFKGTWVTQFEKGKTREDVFILPDGTPSRCQMMQQAGSFRYFATEKFQAIDLPYGKDQFRMSVFLPREDVELDSLIMELSPQTWADWTHRFVEQNGTLYLPKFTINYEIFLKHIVSELGMAIAFDPYHADFSNINQEVQLYISQVLHKTFLQVDEKGTEAAAVTVIDIRLTSVGTDLGFVMRVDHPFFLVIWERHSNTILFLGKIVQPES